MDRKMEDLLLMDEDEIYGEAQRRIGECREKGGRKLDFSCLHLTKIPPEIAELETLTELDITNIELKEIPAFIGNIASLKKLSVGSGLSGMNEGEDITLPPQLGGLRNLQNLSLGYGISVIPKWVFGLENLQALSIFNDTAQTIPAEIANIKKLRKLRIYGENIIGFPHEIGERSALTVLDLNCPELKALPESFSNLKTMKCIRIDNYNLTAIPNFICGWTNLEEIEINIVKKFPQTNILTASRFSPEEIEINIEKVNQGPFAALETIPKNIGNLRKLKRLILRGAGIVKIPDSLGNCPLELLILAGSFRTMPVTFGNLSSLKLLELSSGKPVTLPDSFGNLTALRELEIRVPALKIPPSFGKLAALEKLNIDAEKDLVFPKALGRLSALIEFIVRSREMQSMPNSVGGCKNLKYIQLESDKLTRLPESFCELKKLEELNLDTFALKTLPAAFGSLRALKFVDIFSGALTALPESMGRLKNLKSIYIDAFNVKKLPSSFKLLSYVKQKDIRIGSEKAAALRTDGKKKRGAVGFSGLVNMNYRYCWKFLETCSLKELESFLCSAPVRSAASEGEKEVFKWIMMERRRRLNSKFKWDRNKKRMVKVSDEFLKAWEDGFAKAKKMIEALNHGDDEKKIEIVLYPDIADFKKDGKYRDGIYSAIIDYLNSDVELSMRFYDPLAKNENNFRENIHVSRKLSWNIEGLGDVELEGSYICYALHVLYSHNEWAFEDILKINNISTEIRITCDSGEF